MGWFDRLKKGIRTSTSAKMEAPDGIWVKCKKCKALLTKDELEKNLYVCPKCDYHLPVGSKEYEKILFTGDVEELFNDLESYDFLEFTDLKSYADRLTKAREKTGLKDAITVYAGRVHKMPLVAAIMDFRFIGGSMGSVVGEKIARAIDYCIEYNVPLLIISKSGGARMMESAFSLMQMAKTAAKLSQLARARIPYLSYMTDPTTGGVSASYAMLGDINMAEPGALIGFAGPRVIKDTIKKELPEGFQSAEYLMEHGFLDMIVHRSEMRKTIRDLLLYFANPGFTKNENGNGSAKGALSAKNGKLHASEKNGNGKNSTLSKSVNARQR